MKEPSDLLKRYIYERDHKRCRVCGKHVDYHTGRIYFIYKYMNPILSEFNIHTLYHPLNLILLCPECHVNFQPTTMSKAYMLALIHTNQDREILFPYPAELKKELG